MLTVRPARIMEDNRMVWGYTVIEDGEYDPHRMKTISEKDGVCLRCHFKDNKLLASEQVIPAKSIICMPCHASTISVGDISSIGAIIIFLIGTSSILLAWLSAGKRHDKGKKFNLTDLVNIVKTLILDGLLQKRLLKVSIRRWIIHSIIFFPIIFRFVWGIAALILSLHYPEWNPTWSMLDKNSPLTGFLFDLSGILILLGGCLMTLEKRKDKKRNNIQDLPESRSYIHILLGLIIITGFILEGARIAMTGSPVGSGFAFIGYGISRILVNLDLQGVYIYFWYVHAVITGLFIACLPFSRMVHVIVAPLSVAIKAASEKE
jgi:nitrate reductase gamma subunit